MPPTYLTAVIEALKPSARVSEALRAAAKGKGKASSAPTDAAAHGIASLLQGASPASVYGLRLVLEPAGPKTLRARYLDP